jgi:hypothetical protein
MTVVLIATQSLGLEGDAGIFFTMIILPLQA